MHKLVDLVIRTTDEKGRVRVWHKKDMDLSSLKFKEGLELDRSSLN